MMKKVPWLVCSSLYFFNKNLYLAKIKTFSMKHALRCIIYPHKECCSFISCVFDKDDEKVKEQKI